MKTIKNSMGTKPRFLLYLYDSSFFTNCQNKYTKDPLKKALGIFVLLYIRKLLERSIGLIEAI